MNSEQIEQKIRQILPSNGIQGPVAEVIVEDAGLRGEGFTGLAKYVTVKFDNTPDKPLNLFVKVQTGNPSQKPMHAEMKPFEKESRFLTDYLRAAQKMCKLKGQADFIDFYPKCYHADSQIVILENLVLDKGYQLLNKETRQDLESAKFAVKTLAKHHALSHVMILENGGPENFFRKFPDLNHESFDKPFMVAMMGSSFNSCINSNAKILEKSDIPGAMEAAAKLKSFLGKPAQMVLDSLKAKPETKFLAIGHGDYWNNNMLFLMDKSKKKILHHVAIDFQLTRYNSPGIDLGYYFFTSVQPHVRKSHLQDLLTLYKDTLNKVTEDFGHPTNLNDNDILTDYREKMVYGFWFSFMMTVGPGMGLYKKTDMSKVDVKNFAGVMTELVTNWMEENPEKAKKTAEELVQLLEEFEELKI